MGERQTKTKSISNDAKRISTKKPFNQRERQNSLQHCSKDVTRTTRNHPICTHFSSSYIPSFCRNDVDDGDGTGKTQRDEGEGTSPDGGGGAVSGGDDGLSSGWEYRAPSARETR